MKKISILLAILLIVLCSCATIGIKEKTIAKITVRKVAFYVGLNNPELIQPGLDLCKEVLDTDDESIARELLKVAIKTAMDRIGIVDPFIASDVSDIMDILDIDTSGNIGKFDLGALKFITVGIQEGLEEAKRIKGGI